MRSTQFISRLRRTAFANLIFLALISILGTAHAGPIDPLADGRILPIEGHASTSACADALGHPRVVQISISLAPSHQDGRVRLADVITPDIQKALDHDFSKPINWAGWEEFLPVLEKEYAQRYDLHFPPDASNLAPIVVRDYLYEQPWQVDTGRILMKRIESGDLQAANLLKAGWRVEIGADGLERVFPPKSVKEYFERLYAGIHKHKMKPYELEAIIFLRKGIDSWENPADFKFVRPGVDPAPDPKLWRPALAYTDKLIDLPLTVYAAAMANGTMPFNSIMFDHDNAHQHCYLTHEDLALQNLSFFQALTGMRGEPLHLDFSPGKTSGYALLIRTGTFHEEMNIADLSKEREIRNLVPHLFENPKLRSVEANSANIGMLRQDRLLQRARYLTDRVDSLVARHGGGMNDPYNLFLELNVRSQPKDRVLRYLKAFGGEFPMSFDISGRAMFSQVAVESLHGMAHDLTFMINKLNDKAFLDWAKREWKNSNAVGILDNPTLEQIQTRMRKLIVDRLSRLELAMWAHVHYGITGDIFIRDSKYQSISTSSPTYQALQTYAIPGSLTYLGFISDAATIPPPPPTPIIEAFPGQ
jgi:hypothetical protein